MDWGIALSRLARDDGHNDSGVANPAADWEQRMGRCHLVPRNGQRCLRSMGLASIGLGKAGTRARSCSWAWWHSGACDWAATSLPGQPKGGDDPRYAALAAEWGESFRRRMFWFLQAQAIAGFGSGPVSAGGRFSPGAFPTWWDIIALVIAMLPLVERRLPIIS